MMPGGFRREIKRLRPLLVQRDGATAVEFGLLGPIVIAMMLMVFQLAMAMQAYNAVRSMSADVVRHAVIEYQTGNSITDAQIQTYTTAMAGKSPYLLDPSRVDTTTVLAPTQRVTGATEYTLTISYAIPNVVAFFGLGDLHFTYVRPIFVKT